MSDDLIAQLNPAQREAALADGHSLVVAAPGSGKTKMLATKAAVLLAKGSTVTAVTFTRDSALELMHRIMASAGQDIAPRLLVGTFHSIDLLMCFPAKKKSGLGSEILNGRRTDGMRPWRIVSESLRRSAVMRSVAESGIENLDLPQATAIIEALKSEARPPASEHEKAMVESYQDILKRQGVIDFQDILLNTNRALASGAVEALRTDILLLDEFQDTDAVQIEWAMHHARAGSVLTAVGDDDQSIYAFRRALGYQGMLSFSKELGARTITLGVNYRSNAEVLAPAGRLIAWNSERMGKDLVSFKGEGGRARYELFSSRNTEARCAAHECGIAHARGQSVAVLSRTNRRLDDVEAELVRQGTPYARVAGGDSILNSGECAVFLAALECICDPSVKSADVLMGWSHLSETEISALHKTWPKGVFAHASLERAQLQKLELSQAGRSTLVLLHKRIGEWRRFVATGGENFVIDKLCEILEGMTEDKRSRRTLGVVANIFKADPRLSSESPRTTLNERISQIRKRMERAPSSKEESPQPRVVLTTAHGSKGLEWDFVWVIGAEEGSFPDEASSIQEERRLFYVSMTRARNTLWISGGGRGISRFVDEAGVQRIEADHFRELIAAEA